MRELIDAGAVHTFDEERCGAYLQAGSLWMGYDDEATMRCKASYIHEKGLLGGLLWDLPEDDFLNGSPLISAFHDALMLVPGPPGATPAPTPMVAPAPSPTPVVPPSTSGGKVFIGYFANWFQWWPT